MSALAQPVVDAAADDHLARRNALVLAVTQALAGGNADTASEAFRPKAISWVLFGGVVAAVVGPQLVIATQGLWPPYLFAATYVGQSALALISAGVLMFTNIPKPPPRSAAGDGRPLGAIAKPPRFVVAVACGIAASSTMNLLVAWAPLTMVMCTHWVR